MPVVSERIVQVERVINDLRVTQRTFGMVRRELNLELPDKPEMDEESKIRYEEFLYRVRGYLKIINNEDLPLYIERGYVLSVDLPEKICMSKPATYKHLGLLYPDWKDKFLKVIIQDSHRTYLIPPYVVQTLIRYESSNLDQRRTMITLLRNSF
ncbi:MAG TPA: hypothetical protein VG895_02180 [Patescibacteria group bacterium]|nr:hypothetical protein [Patescibacteria group bacterium]